MTETPKGVIIRTVDKDGKEIDRVPKAAKGNVPHDDYFSGFEVGFQACLLYTSMTHGTRSRRYGGV